jgi:hypothetical protein
MQLGGSLNETVTVPIPGVCTVEVPPLQLTSIPTIITAVPHTSASALSLGEKHEVSLMLVTPDIGSIGSSAGGSYSYSNTRTP